MDENYEITCKEVKCENDLYEGCYEKMELEAEGYEPVTPSPVYENQCGATSQQLATDGNIYEDIQQVKKIFFHIDIFVVF